MRLITKTLLKVSFLAIFVAILLLAMGSHNAFAAEVYQGPCSTDAGNYAITPPFQKDNKSYDCVRNVNNGDIKSGGASCDFGAFGTYSGYDTAFGKACLVPSTVTVGAKAETPKFVKSDCQDTSLNAGNCGIIKYLQIAINALSAVVGLVIVIMIVIGGIQYSAAGDDPQKVQAAKSKVTNALLALFAFIFMFAILQWLVPGGIF